MMVIIDAGNIKEQSKRGKNEITIIFNVLKMYYFNVLKIKIWTLRLKLTCFFNQKIMQLL